MKKNVFTVLLCGLLPLSAQADDASIEQRLQRLEAQISRLQNRVTLLERLLRHSDGAPTGQQVYVCRLNVFAKTYEGESVNQGMAKRQAQKACQRTQQAIFCAVDQIECERY